MIQLVIHHYARPKARPRLWAGIVIATIAIVFGLEQSAHWLAGNPMAAQGLQASLFAGLATGLGAIPVIFLR